jgi:hypothetical protein
VGACSRLGIWKLGERIIAGTVDGKPMKGQSQDELKMNMFPLAINN